MRKIVLAGGSGQIGSILQRHFVAKRDEVIVLTRHAPRRENEVQWNGHTLGPWAKHLEGADLLINLCGRSVNCRYNAVNRRAILDSRIHPTLALSRAVTEAVRPPAVWMNASTATIYRHSLDREMDEMTGELGGHEPGVPETWRFSIEVATRWEEAFAAASTPATRKLALRSAMIMSPDRGGVFDMLLSLVRKGLGGHQGGGKQFVSWIHETDFTEAIEFLLEHPEIDGPVNLASPYPLPNHRFMRALRQAWGTSFGLPSTEWMLEIGAFFLRTETELILKSRRVVPGKLRAAGFHFSFPDWPEAAENLIMH